MQAPMPGMMPQPPQVGFGFREVTEGAPFGNPLSDEAAPGLVPTTSPALPAVGLIPGSIPAGVGVMPAVMPPNGGVSTTQVADMQRRLEQMLAARSGQTQKQ